MYRKLFLLLSQSLLLLQVVGCSGPYGELAPSRSGLPDYSRPSQPLNEDSKDSVQKVALLLPLKGAHQQSAKAIRDGFLAAYYATEESTLIKKTIKIYDTGNGNNPQQLQKAYNDALQDQAEIIVGPLTKPEVQKLQELNPYVPVLALNTLPEKDKTKNQSIFQFGLHPEDEAAEVVRFAREQGLTHALAIVPQGIWGDRMLAAFTAQLEAEQGVLVGSTSIATHTDLNDAIKHLLQVKAFDRKDDRAETRHDAQFIFLGVAPELARQLKPLLNYYYADKLPVFASSHVYNGTPDKRLDRELEGIQFCDMPWILSPTIFNTDESKFMLWEQSLHHSPRLFALGMDAFTLVAEHYPLTQLLRHTYNGYTGNLRLDKNLHIHRELKWAVFKDGIPQVIHETFSHPYH